MTYLRVLTLNCWDVPIPFMCKLRKQRMNAIGDELGKGEHDIVLLQEVWDKADYKLLQEKMTTQYPYSHYFYSAIIGSGVCVFSKVPILETCFHKYSLHGYPHRILDGEWLGGKGVGLCKVEFCGIKINIYSTHFMCGDKHCMAYKISQAFEMSEFVKLTSTDSDIIIVGGDLNLVAGDLGFKLITKNAELSDTWKVWSSENGVKEKGYTCDLPSNSFTASKRVNPDFVGGCRLDYLLFKESKDSKIDVEKCYVTFGRIPGKDYNYSDHEGLAAVFKIEPQRNKGTSPSGYDIATKYNCLEAAVPILEEGIEKIRTLSFYFGIMLVMCGFILYISSSVELPYGLNIFIYFIRVCLTITVGASFWARTVLNDCVKHNLMDTKNNVMTLLDARH